MSERHAKNKRGNARPATSSTSSDWCSMWHAKNKRGNARPATSSTNQKKCGQKYQNKIAFNPNKYQPGGQLKRVATTSPVIYCCPKCTSVIEWKQKYGKYKALTQASKCVDCGEKCVKHAYHVRCSPCATKNGKCAKCGLKEAEYVNLPESTKQDEDRKNADFQVALKKLPERKRRTLLRHLEKMQGGGEDEDGSPSLNIAEYIEKFSKKDGDFDLDALDDLEDLDLSDYSDSE